MARLSLLLFFLFSPLFPFQVSVSSGLDGNQSYSVVRLSDNKPFVCATIAATETQSMEYRCETGKVPMVRPGGSENRLFILQPEVVGDGFAFTVIPKGKSFMVPLEHSTLSPEEKRLEAGSVSDTWLVIGYEKNPPFLKSRENRGINFPVAVPVPEQPTIGSLDVDGQPIRQVGEMLGFGDYKAILEKLKEEKYVDAERIADRLLAKEEVDSLFIPEIIALKLEALDHMGERDEEIVKIGAPWVKAYATHKDLPKVMLILGKAYMKLGAIYDGSYYFDVLIKEYGDFPEAQMAMIYKGDREKLEGKAGFAMERYMKALYATKDVEVASEAAYRIARLHVMDGDTAKGVEFYRKILSTNPAFFVKTIGKSYDLAGDLAAAGQEAFAADLIALLMENVDKTYIDHQNMLRDAAFWHHDAGKLEKAKEYFDRFMDEYSYADNIKEMERERDEVLFEMKERDLKARLEHQDRIMEKYRGEKLADEALHEKTLLLVEEKAYDQALALLTDFMALNPLNFPDVHQESREIQRKIAIGFLRRDRCLDAVNLINRYKVELEPSLDDLLYKCGREVHDYDIALKAVERRLTFLTPVEGREWTEKKIDTHFARAEYHLAAETGEDYLRMLHFLEMAPPQEIFYTLFFSYALTENDEKMAEYAQAIEQRYPRERKNLDVYKAMAERAEDVKAWEKAYTYAGKVIALQRMRGIETFTPWIQILFAQAARETGREEEALEMLEALRKKTLTQEKRGETLYRLFDLLEKRGEMERAWPVLEECAALTEENRWQRLCLERNGTR